MALKQTCICFTSLPRRIKRRCQVVPAHKRSCTNLAGHPQRWKLLYRSSLALKQASTCFTAPPRWLKRPCQVISSHKQACTSLTGPRQSWKLPSQSFLAIKQACTCFTAPPGSLKQLYKDFQHTNMLALSSHGLHSGENCFFDHLWNLNRLPRASQHLLGG